MFSELKKEYDRLQLEYGSSELDSIINGGCSNNPDICFVFMNPTGRNVASDKSWKGIKAPWLGTKSVWDLFYEVNLLDEDVYFSIKSKKPKDWTEEFASYVYNNIESHKVFITNLGKCTQVDARPLPDSVYIKYLDLFYKELELVNPKIVILFGNQVSSIILGEKISVSQCRKVDFDKTINGKTYKFYPVYYPVGNGRFNISKSIEDIKWIMANNL